MEIGSFLNGKGGILCFGCRQNGEISHLPSITPPPPLSLSLSLSLPLFLSLPPPLSHSSGYVMRIYLPPPKGTIYGDWVNRKEEDNIKLIIDTVFKRFRPMVEPQNYRVTFTPVCGWRSRDAGDTGRVLLELRIRPGDPFEMYEDCDHEVSCIASSGYHPWMIPFLICPFIPISLACAHAKMCQSERLHSSLLAHSCPPILLHTATHSMFLVILISPFAHLDVTYDPACINGILFEDKSAVCTMYIFRFAPLFAGVFEEE